MKSEKRTVTGMMLALLLVSLLTTAIDFETARADDYRIHIRPDGSIDPPTAPIRRDGDVYALTGNISDSYGIRVERGNIVFDGANYTLLIGSAGPNALYWSGVNNVTVKNTRIMNSNRGIYWESSSNNTIFRNTLTFNLGGIVLGSDYNTVSENAFVEDGLVVVGVMGML